MSLETKHGEQAGPPYEWGVARINGDRFVVFDEPEGIARLYRVTGSTRNLRVIAQADSVLYRGHLVEPVYDSDIKAVVFYHDFGGRMFNQPVDGWLRRPAHLLEEVHIATQLLDYPDSPNGGKDDG